MEIFWCHSKITFKVIPIVKLFSHHHSCFCFLLMYNHFPILLLLLLFLLLHWYQWQWYQWSWVSGSSSSNSTSSSIINIIFIIISSSSINKISHLLYQPLFQAFQMFPVAFTSIYSTNIYLRDHNGNIVKKLFCVICAIAHYREVSTTIFNFNEFIFVYVVNIRFTCDGTIYLLTYLSCNSDRTYHKTQSSFFYIAVASSKQFLVFFFVQRFSFIKLL